MKTEIKIAGTTFHPLPENQYLRVNTVYEKDGVSCAETNAVLVPEPDNPHDPEAVKVIVPLENGQPFQIGYLPRASKQKQMVKQPCQASITVKDFTKNNLQYSSSWIITEIIGL